MQILEESFRENFSSIKISSLFLIISIGSNLEK